MLVYGECECFAMQMLYGCVLCASCGSSHFCMTCSLLMLVEDAIGDHTERRILQSRSFNCFFCTEMLLMCGLFVSFGSKVRPITFGCVAMGSTLLFIVRSRLLVYSAGYGVNRVQVVLSGFSKRLFCFVQAKTLCRYGCKYLLDALVLVCADVIVMSSA